MLDLYAQFDIIQTYINERIYIMSKVKQWAWDKAEKAVDIVIDKLKKGNLSLLESIGV